MSTILWVVLPILMALGAALLALDNGQRRLEVQLDRERQALTVTRRIIEDEKTKYEEKRRSWSEAAQQRVLDGWLADLRTEQRRFVRHEEKGSGIRRLLVVQERLCFRNIPLSNWLAQEVPIEEGVSVEEIAKSLSVFRLEDREADSGSAFAETNPLEFREG